jgi:hypothetical protein
MSGRAETELLPRRSTRTRRAGWRGPWARRERRSRIGHGWTLAAAAGAHSRVPSRGCVQSRPGSASVSVMSYRRPTVCEDCTLMKICPSSVSIVYGWQATAAYRACEICLVSSGWSCRLASRVLSRGPTRLGCETACGARQPVFAVSTLERLHRVSRPWLQQFRGEGAYVGLARGARTRCSAARCPRLCT